MNCKSSKSLTLDYFDGTLSTDQRQELDEHLEKCDSCQKVYNRLSVLLSEESHLQRFKVSSQFHQNLWKRIEDLRLSTAAPSSTRTRNTAYEISRSVFLIPKLWIPRLSYGFASLLFAALITFSVLKVRQGGVEMGSTERGVSPSRAEEFSPSPSEIEGKIYVLEPLSNGGDWLLAPTDLRFVPAGDEIFLIDNRALGGDTLVYSLPVYSGEMGLVSY